MIKIQINLDNSAVSLLNTIIATLIIGLVAFSICWATFTTPYKNSPVIRSDGRGYHSWVHQIIIGPWNSCEFKQLGYLTELDNGKCINKYPIGSALITLPIFIPFSNMLSNTKLLGVEHKVVLFVAAIICFGTFIILFLIARIFNVGLIASAMLSIVTTYGTGVFHYGTYDAGFSHIYSVFCLSLILHIFLNNFYLGIKGHWSTLIVLGILGFWFLLIRNTNIFSTTFISIYFIFQYKKSSLLPVFALLLGVVFALSFQLFYNWDTLGKFTISSYVGESFLWERPMFFSVLASYERGLLNYYPVFVFSLLAMIFFNGSSKITYLCVFMTIFYAIFYGFWHSWTLGSGFGHRGFIDFVPIIFLGSVEMWKKISNLKLKIALVNISLLLTFSTVALMAGYWNNKLPWCEVNRIAYWAQFDPKNLFDNFRALYGNAYFFTVHKETALIP